MQTSELNSIKCCNLSYKYSDNSLPALHNVNFTISRGEIVALLGPNGSGKSTLLKVLCRTLAPKTGNIYLLGKDLLSFNFKELAKTVAFVPQEEFHVFDFSSKQIVLMGRASYSEGLFESKEDHFEAEKALEACDCVEFADRPITELSGGEKQRILIARAIAQCADIYLFDEPASHLDISHQIAITKIIKELSANGKTIVIAMHDLNWASSLTNRSILMHNGSVVLDGQTQTVLNSTTLEGVYKVKFEKTLDTNNNVRLFHF